MVPHLAPLTSRAAATVQHHTHHARAKSKDSISAPSVTQESDLWEVQLPESDPP